MYHKDIEDKYQEIKKTIVLCSSASFPGLITYGFLLENMALCHYALLITLGIGVITSLLWIGEIIDYSRAVKAGRVIAHESE